MSSQDDPSFAVICAFLEQFAGLCAIEHPNFASLLAMLENEEEVHAELVDLHVKLLRKIRYAVHVDRWERSLAKFCHTYSMNDAWELERFSYKLLKLPMRLRILKNLLETQFDNNVKFKTAVNNLKTSDLRPVPLGRDKMGNVYWRTLDADLNIRIYQENQDEESLRVVATNRDELAKLIAVLSGKEPMIPNLAGLVDEDSSSNSDIVPNAEQAQGVVQEATKEEEEEENKIEQSESKTEGHPKPSTLSSAAAPSNTRLTLLGKNNLAKINKFKLMNAKKSQESEDEEELGDEEEEEDEDNYDEEDMDVEPSPVVGSVIQERVVYIRGEGAGKQNNAGNLPPTTANDDNGDDICGEAIEEPLMIFCGEGSGRECDVGNPGQSNDDKEKESEAPKPAPKPMFFFGRPGCLKLSPMKPAETVKPPPEPKPTETKVSLVAYDDSNSGSNNSRDSEKTGEDEEKKEKNSNATSESVVSTSETESKPEEKESESVSKEEELTKGAVEEEKKEDEMDKSLVVEQSVLEGDVKSEAPVEEEKENSESAKDDLTAEVPEPETSPKETENPEDVPVLEEPAKEVDDTKMEEESSAVEVEAEKVELESSKTEEMDEQMEVEEEQQADEVEKLDDPIEDATTSQTIENIPVLEQQLEMEEIKELPKEEEAIPEEPQEVSIPTPPEDIPQMEVDPIVEPQSQEEEKEDQEMEVVEKEESSSVTQELTNETPDPSGTTQEKEEMPIVVEKESPEGESHEVEEELSSPIEEEAQSISLVKTDECETAEETEVPINQSEDLPKPAQENVTTDAPIPEPEVIAEPSVEEENVSEDIERIETKEEEPEPVETKELLTNPQEITQKDLPAASPVLEELPEPTPPVENAPEISKPEEAVEIPEQNKDEPVIDHPTPSVSVSEELPQEVVNIPEVAEEEEEPEIVPVPQKEPREEEERIEETAAPLPVSSEGCDQDPEKTESPLEQPIEPEVEKPLSPPVAEKAPETEKEAIESDEESMGDNDHFADDPEPMDVPSDDQDEDPTSDEAPAVSSKSEDLPVETEEEERMEVKEAEVPIQTPVQNIPEVAMKTVEAPKVPLQSETLSAPEPPVVEKSIPDVTDSVPEHQETESASTISKQEEVAEPEEVIPVTQTRARRGRRSDPVVAENVQNHTEVLTETPRATRGQANKKESPKAATSATVAPKKNSRKGKNSEEAEEISPPLPQIETQGPKVEEVLPVEPEPPKEEVKLEPEPEKEEQLPIPEEKPEDSEAEEEEVATPSARKPQRGRKGRKWRKPPAKPKATPTTEEVKPEESSAVEVKEEPSTDPTMKAEEEPSTVPPEETPPVEPPKPAKKGRRQNRMMGLYVDEIQPQEDVGTVRQSRRIAQIKIKEETDRRLQEEVALEKLKDAAKKRAEASSDDDSSSDVKIKGKGKKGKKAEKEKKVKTTWHSNSNTSDEDEKDEDDEDNFGVVEEDPGSPLFKSDHEFSCESDVDGEEYVPTKMARTARKKKAAASGDSSSEEEDNPDHACQKCGKHDHPEWILLCDTCDKGYHCSCLIPVLFIIPEGDWYCPECQHGKLLERLTLQLEELDSALKAKEREEARLRRQAMNSICVENILPPDEVPPEREVQQTGRQRSRRSSPLAAEESEGSSSSDSGSEDSDDMPIYKLRKRRQKGVSYRFNDYDDLINSAIQGDMRDDRDIDEIVNEGEEDGAAPPKAGNLGRGKDISTIMEAENEKTRKELSQSDESGSDEEFGGRRKAANVDESDSDSEPIRKSGKQPKGAKAAKKGGRKKNRKLNNLDLSSDDDGSDEDFAGSSADSEDSVEEDLSSGSSEDSMELAMYRKKNKKNSSTTRRSVRARVKRFDKDFINDDDDDESDEREKAPKKRKKKEESDFSDFDEDDDEEGSSEDLEENERDLDSEDLCDDSDSESSEDRPWGSKKKKSSSKKLAPKVYSKNPIQSAGKVPRNPKRKPAAGSDDNEKPYKASVAKKKKVIASDDDEGDGGSGAAAPTRAASSRRTRGKKINFLEVVESGSSDDGIKPGVKRPDTPPEEREQFIKRQEEIKKMLAAKNTQGAIQAATPKLEPLKLSLAGMRSGESLEQDPNSLSTIPRNIIQSAKALDTDYHKSRESGEEFDAELPDDFNPEDMDMEEDLDRIMEDGEGEFAVQQLKLGGESVLRGKKSKGPKETPEKNKLEPIPPVSAQLPQELLAKPGGGYPMGHSPQMQGPHAIPHSVIQGMPPKGVASHLPPPPHLIPDGAQHVLQQPHHHPGMQRMPLMMPQGGPPPRFLHGPGGPMAAGPSAMGQNVIVGPRGIPGGPSFPPFGNPNAAPMVVNPPPSGESPKSGQVPKKRGRKPKEAPPVVPDPVPVAPPVTGDSVIPTTVLGHEANSAAATSSPKKGGGRRKKVTPSREELQAAAAAAAAQGGSAPPPGKSEGAGEPPSRGSILSERLEAGEAKPGPPVGPQSPYNASVITRLPQPGATPGAAPSPSSLPGPYPGQGGPPPRFYQHQGIGAPPPNSMGMHHMAPHERMHFMQQHPRHMGLQPHMYRPPSSIYGNPYQGQHAPPPHLQRPQLDSHGVRPMHPQDYSNSYLPPQFGPYIPGHHPNPHIRGAAPPVSSAEEAKGGKLGKLPSTAPTSGPPAPHPSQIAHYEALKAGAGGPPMYNPPYPGHPVPLRHPGEPHPEQPNRGEFSGLVSYFSSQHDDLEQQ